MYVGKVVGRFVSTRKHDGLIGCKFLLCDLIGHQDLKKIVASDSVGAGIGDHVLIVMGQAARLAESNHDKPIDAAIVGIIDEENDLSILE